MITQTGQSSTSDKDDFTYDANGNLKTWRRRSGEFLAYVYDDLNRIVEKQLLMAAGNVSYDYDLLSRLTDQTMADSSQDIVFEYDHANRVKSVTQGTRTVNYLYDPAGNRTRMTWPDGFFVEYDYDQANRMERIDEMTATLLAGYQYDDLYLRKLVTLGNGTTTSYSYSNESRLKDLIHDFAGTAQDVTVVHDYSQVGQLLSRTTSNTLFDWKPSAGAGTTYAANGLNQYTDVDGVPQQHDGNGNLADDGQWMLGFDVENRLISATNTGSTASFEYDAEGRRLTKEHNGTLHQYLYDGADVIAVYDNLGNLIQRYVHGPGVDEPIVWYDYDTQGTLQSKRWFYADHQGSVIATADAAGAADQVYTYSPFGVPGQQGPSIFRYTGQVWDEETGLAYYKARYYSPTRGRFRSTDPAGYIDSMNLYAYVVNDPINFSDPNGEFAVQAAGGVIGGLGGVLFQAGSDLFRGELSSGSDYAGALVGGIAGGIAATTCGPACAGAVAGSASNITEVSPFFFS